MCPTQVSEKGPRIGLSGHCAVDTAWVTCPQQRKSRPGVVGSRRQKCTGKSLSGSRTQLFNGETFPTDLAVHFKAYPNTVASDSFVNEQE